MAHQHLCLLLCAAVALLCAVGIFQQYPYPNQPGNIPGVSSVRNCQVCSTWGNYHFKTFDGDLYQLKSDCNYLFAASYASSHQDFSVQVRRGQGQVKGSRPVITRVILSLGGVTVEITAGGVLVNGNPAVLPVSQGGVRVEQSHSYIKVKAKLGLMALWCPDSFLLELDNKYQNQTRGLCGDFNSVPLNEFYRNGVKMSLAEFAGLWKQIGLTEKCADIDTHPTPPSCEHMRPVCERLFYSHAFKPCRPYLDVDSFLSACVKDACHCPTNAAEHDLSSCLCITLSEFYRQCVRAGGKPKHWRTKKLCWKTCPLKMEYRECSSPVMDTCSNPDASSTNDEHCMDGCFCPEGMVLDDLTGKGCIPPNQCSCSYNGHHYAPGESYSTKCKKCVCASGQWNCAESKCPGMCSLEGGAHVTTFDGKAYTFHGDCSYTMAKDCSGNQFIVQAELKQCGTSDTETCLKAVVLALNGGAHIVTVKSSGKVFVNGIYAPLPFSTVGVTVFKASSFYILVQTSVGVLLEVQLQPIMQLFITVQTQLKDKTCGLCGNFNGNQADDFMKLSGVIEATAAGFANSWKTCANCMDVKPVYENPCSQNQDKEHFAQRWCKKLTDKDGVFAPCHSVVSPHPYYKRCTYDSCNCERSEDSMCAAVSSYVHACAAAGVHIPNWRDVMCGKYSLCPSGMVYSYNITSGPGTCRCRHSFEPDCNLSFPPVDGCVCSAGTYHDESGNCVLPQNCPCYYEDTVVPVGQRVKINNAYCTCENGQISCVGIPITMPPPPMTCTPPMFFYDCSAHGPHAKGKECEKSCATLDSTCVKSACVSGCMCPRGMISDDRNGCVRPEACPCIHNGIAYSPGQTIKVDCNTCTCMNRKWACTKMLCDSICTMYGNGHYRTFDQHRFMFDGSCEYILVQDHCGNSKGTFSVVVESTPCGAKGKGKGMDMIKGTDTGTSITCSKTIKIFLPGSELILTEGDYQLQGASAQFHIITMGLYLVIETNIGLTLIWDRKTVLVIKLSLKYKGRVCGLCGNYDGNANNDMTTRCGATVVNPLVFGNSWKDSPNCPDVQVIPNPCKINPHQLHWAQKKCSIIHGPVFSACHSSVDPTPFYDACVFDTCSCDSGGHCESLCSAVAIYAEACNQAGKCVEWRNPEFCPVVCEYYTSPDQSEWHYKPCGAPCMKTCRNPSGHCSSNILLEGCYPKCPHTRPYFDETTRTCVTKDKCGCYNNEGTHFNDSDIVPSSQSCYVCICKSSVIQCHYDGSACGCIYHGVQYPVGSVLYETSDGHGNCIRAVCGHNGTIEHNLHPCTDPTSTPTTVSVFTPGSTNVYCCSPHCSLFCILYLFYFCSSILFCWYFIVTYIIISAFLDELKCCKIFISLLTESSESHAKSSEESHEKHCYWTKWINSDHPAYTKKGGDFETINRLLHKGYAVCKHPIKVRCRAVKYPRVPLRKLGQFVTCNTDIGFVCKNRQQYPHMCLDYEIKMCCRRDPITPIPTLPPFTDPVPTCHCHHKGATFFPGQTVYNYTDFQGYCYIGYCNQSCDIVVLHYQCISAPPTSAPYDCMDLLPPRKNGETWKKSGCRIATCKNGKVLITKVACPVPERIVCANNFPPVKVYDNDGCCWHYECQCKYLLRLGDQHHVTFDGTYYAFEGDCSYWLIKEVFPLHGFSVMISNHDCVHSKSYRCHRSITIFYKHYKIYMSQKNITALSPALVNDKAVTSVYQTPEFRVFSTSINIVLLIPKIKAKVTFSWHLFKIKLPFSLFGSNTQGQCGKCDNNRADDCIVPSAPMMFSCTEMAHEWHTNDSYCPPPVITTPKPTSPYCDSTLCDIIKSRVFEPCHRRVDYHTFFAACQADSCNSHNPRVCCRSLQMYASACNEVGVCIDWRSETHGLCDYKCSSPKVYEACGPPIEPTCDSWFNRKFVYYSNEFNLMTFHKRCEGCYCPNGTMLLSAYSNECVPSCELCRLPNGKWKKANDVWTEGCETCRCDENTLQVMCQPKLCPPVFPPFCDIYGQVLVTEIVNCCPFPRCECNKSLCNDVVPLCPPGMTLTTIVGVCCDKYHCVPKEVCVVDHHEYQVGEVVPRGNCERCVCSEKTHPHSSLHVLDCKPLPCDTYCSPGYEYQLIPGQCCGRCVQIGCFASLGNVSHTLQPGEQWSPNPCVKFDCVRIGNQYLTVESKTVCPPFNPQDCIPGTEMLTSDGCCRVCIPKGHPCSVSSSNVYLESQGCRSKKPVNMTSCSGACATFTFYCMKTDTLKHSCSCCHEVTTSKKRELLLCKDGSQIYYTYDHIETCACLKTSCSVLDPDYTTTSIPITIPYFQQQQQLQQLHGHLGR
ncbi:hypothetical protein WMY93_006887 [Mugilogobius chulae]|uniref:Uncharacterized protein n=1 Tax=Mugilogobius chulae TaxID=88201 RepID=A0AAW0PNP1_9GOBI